MSASRDQSQKIAFVYSNLYNVYQKGKAAAKAADVPAAVTAPITAPVTAEAIVAHAVAKRSASPHVLKTDDLHKPEKAAVKVTNYTPTEFLGNRVARPASIPAKTGTPTGAPKEAISSLKDNLKALNDLHSRLRFMLQELEDLVKE
jgi:hypothetical protein